MLGCKCAQAFELGAERKSELVVEIKPRAKPAGGEICEFIAERVGSDRLKKLARARMARGRGGQEARLFQTGRADGSSEKKPSQRWTSL